MNNPQNIKPGDKIRYVRMRKVGTPKYYSNYIGKQFIVRDGMNSNGFSVENDSDTPFFYYDEVELVGPPTSMFEFGPYNEDMKDRFLAYLNGVQSTGICSATNNYVFMQSEIDKTGYDKSFPIEHAISKKNHKKRTPSQLKNLYESQRERDANWLIITGMNSPNTPYGKLRRWWAYNLAVAVSNQGVEVTEVTEEPKEPEFDSNIILTAKIGDKITLDGIEFTLEKSRNEVYLSSPPVDGIELLTDSYPYLHVRNISEKAIFTRVKLKNLIDSKNYKIS